MPRSASGAETGAPRRCASSERTTREAGETTRTGAGAERARLMTPGWHTPRVTQELSTLADSDGVLDRIPTHEVFVLGAGFSKAINESMPLVSELLGPLDAVLANHTGCTYPATRDVELLLSSIAVDQPFLDEGQNLRNRALFADVTKWLAHHIFEHQHAALRQTVPDWLGKLVVAWHKRRSTVITLNYDTLIESAVQCSELKDDADSPRAQAHHTFAVPVPFAMARFGGSWFRYEPRSTFTLCRLHGSLSWWREAPSLTGLFDVETWKDSFGSETDVSWREVEANARGLAGPLLVPPTLVKSGLHDNPVLRANWATAFARLQEATTIVVMGYSFPGGDSQMAALLGSAFKDKEVIVVDVAPDDVRRRISTFGSRFASISSYLSGGSKPIPEFAQVYSDNPNLL